MTLKELMGGKAKAGYNKDSQDADVSSLYYCRNVEDVMGWNGEPMYLYMVLTTRVPTFSAGILHACTR